MAKYIGKDMSRVDGVAKVTGKAKYAAEFAVPNAAYGFIVQSTITKGSIKTIDVSEAEKLLVGKDATEANFKSAAEAEMKNAKPLEHNKFKVELGKRAIVRALNMAINGK